MLPVNIDLFLSGLSIAASLLLGFIVFFKNHRSITNIFFLAFAVVNSCWIIFNYIAFIKMDPLVTLLAIRIVMCFAIYQAFFFFLLMNVFPNETIIIPAWWKKFLLPIVLIVSILTLTPLIFSGVNMLGTSPQPIPGPGIILFALTALSLVIGGIVAMLRKTFTASGVIRIQFIYITTGVILMFLLIVSFNFLLTALFGNASFVRASSIFTLPFIILTTYAIIKHQLLNIKIIGTEILTFILVIITFFEVLLASSLGEVIFRIGLFLGLLVFSILLIRSVIKEVEQREKLEDLTTQLASANERLEELDKLKDEFLSVASHELRTPMTAIKSYLWMALYKSTAALDPKAREYLEIAFKATDRLIRLVQDLLTISRIEGKRLVFDMEILDVSLLAQQAYKELKIKADENQLQLSYEPATEPLMAKIDKTRIIEVLENLLGNALKFTPTGGKVSITTKKSDGMIDVRISDTGPGIADKDKELLFQKFNRLDNTQTMAAPGTGLGLYIAKQIVTLHGGQIWVESKLGEGATFAFSLPLIKEQKS